MPSLPSLSSQFADSVDRPRSVLAERVQAALSDSANGPMRTVRLAVPVADAVDPIQWIRAQDATEVVYWADRAPDAISSKGRSLRGTACRNADERRTVAAVGQADIVTGGEQPVDYAELRRQLATRFERTDDSLRYYGGLRFDAAQSPSPRTPSERWAAFGTYRFVLPRFELVERADQQALVCNLVLPRDRERADALVEAVRSLAMPTATPHTDLPRPIDRTDRPERDGWAEMVRWALDAIDERRLEKVVLARQVELGLARPVDPMRVLHHVKAATPGCFHFAFRPDTGHTFMGASPERLFRWTGDQVVSEAIAGTRGRGDTPEADAALREELLTSEKERREHRFVQEAIEAVLEALCTSIESPDTPSELVLARGRHLHARITGALRADVTVAELLDALHPTPAVGGVPHEAALSAIRDQEPFDRGWYAGPVGWIGPEAAEFAVAIRSGLVQSDRLALFSGAGIVAGSVPDREWEEIEQKIGDFAAVLGLLNPSNGIPQ